MLNLTNGMRTSDRVRPTSLSSLSTLRDAPSHSTSVLDPVRCGRLRCGRSESPMLVPPHVGKQCPALHGEGTPQRRRHYVTILRIAMRSAIRPAKQGIGLPIVDFSTSANRRHRGCCAAAQHQCTAHLTCRSTGKTHGTPPRARQSLHPGSSRGTEPAP